MGSPRRVSLHVKISSWKFPPRTSRKTLSRHRYVLWMRTDKTDRGLERYYPQNWIGSFMIQVTVTRFCHANFFCVRVVAGLTTCHHQTRQSCGQNNFFSPSKNVLLDSDSLDSLARRTYVRTTVWGHGRQKTSTSVWRPPPTSTKSWQNIKRRLHRQKVEQVTI